MVGKDPHRKQGKADADEWARPASEMRQKIKERSMEPGGEPSRYPAEELRGGARPGIPRRMMGEMDEDDDEASRQ